MKRKFESEAPLGYIPQFEVGWSSKNLCHFNLKYDTVI